MSPSVIKNFEMKLSSVQILHEQMRLMVFHLTWINKPLNLLKIYNIK